MRKITLIFLLAFLGLSLNLNAQTDDVINEDSIREAKLLALPEVKDFAKRVGDTLFLKFDNGKSDFLSNYIELYAEAGGLGEVSIELLKKEFSATGPFDTIFKKQEFRLLKMSGNEQIFMIKHQGWILISKVNGLKFYSSENPIFAPDNNRFICIKSYITDPNQDNTIREISINNTSQSELELKATTWDLVSIIWTTNIEVKITRKSYSGKTLPPFIYKFNGTKWELATETPVKAPTETILLSDKSYPKATTKVWAIDRNFKNQSSGYVENNTVYEYYMNNYKKPKEKGKVLIRKGKKIFLIDKNEFVEVVIEKDGAVILYQVTESTGERLSDKGKKNGRIINNKYYLVEGEGKFLFKGNAKDAVITVFLCRFFK